MPDIQRLALRVTPAAERAIRDGHPWLYAEAITQQKHNGRAGDLAVIFDRHNRFLAVGLYDPASPLRVRILHQGSPAAIGADWWAAQVRRAAAARPGLPSVHTTGYRLLYGENDGFPGLVADCYGETCVLKLYTAAWWPHLDDVLAGLTAVLPPPQLTRIVLRLSRAVQLPGLVDGAILHGPPLTGPVVFLENGLRFAADVAAGQKTGFFLDQRDNRARVEPLAAGRDVLNVFAYTGGFSLYAARGGAKEVISLDLSRPALEAAAANFALNADHPAIAATRHELLVGDAFVEMGRLADNGRTFDLVIIDPPAFAKKQAEVARAQGAYERLVSLGLAVLRPGGVLVMASCSSRVSAEQFFKLVEQTAKREKRPLQPFAYTTHPLDHPIRFPEAAYLKCLFGRRL